MSSGSMDASKAFQPAAQGCAGGILTVVGVNAFGLPDTIERQVRQIFTAAPGSFGSVEAWH